jgi:biopolymer transport protein ExbD
MARSFHRKERMTAMSEINVTPLIDLAFALLIIFMITAPLLEQTIDIRLPSESARPQQPSTGEMVRISLNAEGQVFWNDDGVARSDLEQRLSALRESGDSPIMRIRADAQLPYQQVVDIMDLLKKYELTRISLETQSR